MCVNEKGLCLKDIYICCRFKEAEEDCTTAISLDSTYSKAFARRATARVALGKLQEAKQGAGKINIFLQRQTAAAMFSLSLNTLKTLKTLKLSHSVRYFHLY